MTNDIAISAKGLGKRYRRGAAAAQHDSLRDLLRFGVPGLLSRGKRDNAEQNSFWALSDASFEIGRGENVGIIGLNGAGKSTLLKILSRITTPTTGTARINGRMGALLEVGTGFHQELTGRENVFLYGSILGMSREEVASKFDAIVEFAEIAEFIDTPVKRYSSGMYVRLAFSVAAHLDPDILLLDEVLAVGDYTFQRKCMDFARGLEKKGATILFVSHNMFQIKTMCHRVIYLRKGRVVFDGPTDQGLKLYEDDCRLAPAPWFSPEQGGPSVTITDVRLSNEAGAEQAVFDYGERLRLRVGYEVLGIVERPDIRIGINRQDDVHCCSYSTAADGVDLPELSGTGTIELLIPPLKLVADRYVATVSVREKSNGRMICAVLAVPFHIRHAVYTPLAFGVFHDAGEWEIKPAHGNSASDIPNSASPREKAVAP